MTTETYLRSCGTNKLRMKGQKMPFIQIITKYIGDALLLSDEKIDFYDKNVTGEKDGCYIIDVHEIYS